MSNNTETKFESTPEQVRRTIIHQGEGLRAARFLNRMTQTKLAQEIETLFGKKMFQSEVSRFECEFTIPDETIEMFAKVLSVDADEIRNYMVLPPNETNSNVQNINNHATSDSTAPFNNVSGKATIYCNDKKVAELYQDIVNRLDKQIEELKKENSLLKVEIKELNKK